jgi:hypothetical protein
MKRAYCVFLLAFLVVSAFAQQNVPDLAQMADRFAPTELKVDTSHLSDGDRKALAKLIEASRIINDLYMRQMWEKNPATWAQMKSDSSPLGRVRARYYWINKGPWSDLDENRAFIPGVPERRPEGANFYPEGANKEELEAWMKSLPEKQQEQARGFFTVVRRGKDGELMLVPFSQEYRGELQRMSKLLKEAAALTTNATLKRFLDTRAAAFLSNDYYESDVAWMELDAPVDVTIGPYETYMDELFGYKAAFQSYINVRDEKESAKLKFFAAHLQDIESNLPIEAQYRNPKIGAGAAIVVVNELFGAGHGDSGVQTAAYNLPNDERVVAEKGSKRVMLKNIQQAKFDKTLVAIARVVLNAEAQKDLDFESFFTHILAHELTHGLGPQVIKVDGRTTSARQELKELYGSIEEAKADVTGLFALQHMMDKGLLKDSLGQGEAAERKLYNTYLASAFRTLRFGVKSSHARGMALQFNYLRDQGAYILNDDGSFSVNFAKIKPALRDLDRELLMLQARGDYAGAKAMLDKLSVIRPEMQRAMDKLKDVPTDIEPKFVTADQIAPAKR